MLDFPEEMRLRRPSETTGHFPGPEGAEDTDAAKDAG